MTHLSTAEQLVREAVEATRRGDRAAARNRLDRIARGEATGPVPWVLIAQIEQALGNDTGASDALSHQLETSPRDLTALLLQGAIKARSGEDRSATIFYRAALNVADLPGVLPPPSLVPMLQAARTFVEEANRRFTDHLERAVGMSDAGSGESPSRLRASIDLLLGRTDLYLQQPSMFYFPGLPQRAFYERHEFAWMKQIELAVPEMRRELEGLMTDQAGFAPYVQRSPDQPPPANPLLNDPSWGARYLWRNGARVEPTASICPATMAALSLAPIPGIAGRSPMALYSLLKPGTHIQPHHGLLNTRLICHVPLIAPDGCGLRVGAETRTWREGEALIFDDSIEHEAWNRGDSLRVVLLFEIWRPEITEDEQHALTDIFEAIDAYQGAAIDAG